MPKLLLAIMLALATSLSAQRIEDGGVTLLTTIPIGNGYSWDFSIFGGFANGYGSRAQTQGGHFSFSDADQHGPIEFNYTGIGGCAAGCDFHGYFTRWYAPQVLDADCVIWSGLITGDLYTPNRELYGLNGEYYQAICQLNGVYWNPFGGISVHK